MTNKPVAQVLISLLDFYDLPNPGTGFNGKGTPDGFQPGSQLHLAWTDGDGDPLSVRSCPQPVVLISTEGMEPHEYMGLLLRAVQHKAAGQKLAYYGLPLEWNAFVGWGDKKVIAKVEAETALAIKRNRGLVDRYVIDAHNFTEIDLAAWRRSIAARMYFAAASGLPVDVCWEAKWHTGSNDKSRAGKPLTLDEARPRIEAFRALKPAAFWLMGGGRDNPETGRWELTSKSEYRDIDAICDLLTGKAA